MAQAALDDHRQATVLLTRARLRGSPGTPDGRAAATGATAWVARYGHPAKNSAGEAVKVSPDSAKVYVTGDTSPYVTTVAYNS
jgi:hypothetical protein